VVQLGIEAELHCEQSVTDRPLVDAWVVRKLNNPARDALDFLLEDDKKSAFGELGPLQVKSLVERSPNVARNVHGLDFKRTKIENLTSFIV
jgi:hypothetical protein